MECTACGYSGDMDPDGRALRCPACGVVGRFESKFLLIVDCPHCQRALGLSIEDSGKTVLCPGCSCFLGTPVAAPSAQKAPRSR